MCCCLCVFAFVALSAIVVFAIVAKVVVLVILYCSKEPSQQCVLANVALVVSVLFWLCVLLRLLI